MTRDEINDALARLSEPTRRPDEEPEDSSCDWTLGDMVRLWADLRTGETTCTVIRLKSQWYARVEWPKQANMFGGSVARVDSTPELALARAIILAMEQTDEHKYPNRIEA